MGEDDDSVQDSLPRYFEDMVERESSDSRLM